MGRWTLVKRLSVFSQWAPILVGLFVLYVPTYMDLARSVWSEDFGGEHGPLVLAIAAWLLWRQRGALLGASEDTRPVLGGMLIFAGLFLYVVGRSQAFFIFEVGSQLPLLLGIVLALKGTRALQQLWFPICFLAFLVPLPGSLLDAILMPLKQGVSVIVDQLLYWAGYPIARNGVVLSIGPYQLLIANACAGLNSMIALTAIGVLFVYLVEHEKTMQRWVLLLSILPIALIANTSRVLVLVLVTYHYGDGMGRAFHALAGYAEIAFAFGAFFMLDAVLQRFSAKRSMRMDWV